MKYEESRYPQDWFRIGDKELERSRNLLSLEDMEESLAIAERMIQKIKGLVD